jgi:hypothetical protein
MWLQQVQDSYQQDTYCQQLIVALAFAPGSMPHFTLLDGILRYNNRIWLGDKMELQHQILQAMQSSAMGGHSGFPITYRRLKQLFA